MQMITGTRAIELAKQGSQLWVKSGNNWIKHNNYGDALLIQYFNLPLDMFGVRK